MNKKIEGINEEFQELGNALNDLKSSSNAEKKKIYDMTLNKVNRKEGNYMLKNKFKKAGAAAALIMIIGVASNPTYAADLARKLVTDVTFGKVSFSQNTEAGVEPLDECFKGKVFDKDGNEVTSIDINAFCYDHTQKLYTKDGKEIAYMKDGEIVTVEQEEEEDKQKSTIIEDKDKIKEYASFDYKLPDYVPEGYEFINAKYKKYEGVTDGKTYYMYFLELNYKNKTTGESYGIEECYSEVPFSSVSNKKMEQIKINDNDGVLYETGDIGFEMNDVSYMIHSEGLDKDENLKIAESIK